MSDLQHVRAQRQRRALEILAGEADGLTGVDLWERVSSEIPLLPEELGVIKDGKTPRARVTWMFQTSKQTLAGWLAKASLWRVTAAGHQALADYTDPDAFAKARAVLDSAPCHHPVSAARYCVLRNNLSRPILTDSSAPARSRACSHDVAVGRETLQSAMTWPMRA